MVTYVNKFPSPFFAASLNVSNAFVSFGKDYYLLPSSIHEALIVPYRPDMEVDSLATMVREVNATQVAKDEQLSDHVYRYDYDKHSLVIAA